MWCFLFLVPIGTGGTPTTNKTTAAVIFLLGGCWEGGWGRTAVPAGSPNKWNGELALFFVSFFVFPWKYFSGTKWFLWSETSTEDAQSQLAIHRVGGTLDDSWSHEFLKDSLYMPAKKLYTYLYIYEYYSNVLLSISIHVWNKCICTCIYTYMHIFIYIYMYICMYVYMLLLPLVALCALEP